MKVDLNLLVRHLRTRAMAMTAMANHLNELKKKQMIHSAMKGVRASMKEAPPEPGIHDAGEYGEQYNLDDYGASEYAEFFHLGKNR